MNGYNLFDLPIAVVFDMSPQLGGLGPKAQDLVIYFHLDEVETLPQLHLRDLRIRSELDLLQYQTGKIKNLTGKYIMELSKLKHLQIYMTPFDLYYRKFERHPQIQKLSITFTPTIEEVFETLETADIDMTPSQLIIEPIVNLNFGNKFQHQNGPNQSQPTHKNTIQHHQHRNNSQQYQNRNNSQQYQHIYFQRSSTSSIPYLK